MFGYIVAYKPEMKIKDYEIYKGIYCTLCKRLSRRYTPAAQLFLSYDFVFLAAVRLSLQEACPVFHKSRCMYNPLAKCARCDGDEGVMDRCADTAVIMSYYKLLDNFNDGNFLRKAVCIFLYLPVFLMWKKAKKRNPHAQDTVASAVSRQKECEKDQHCSVDMAADASAAALANLVSAGHENSAYYESLRRFGYLVGRWAYLMDAADDLARDMKTGNFNPFRQYLEAGGVACDNVKSSAAAVLYTTAGGAAAEIANIPFRRFLPLLENIVYLGMKSKTDAVLGTQGETKNEQSV